MLFRKRTKKTVTKARRKKQMSVADEPAKEGEGTSTPITKEATASAPVTTPRTRAAQRERHQLDRQRKKQPGRLNKQQQQQCR